MSQTISTPSALMLGLSVPDTPAGNPDQELSYSDDDIPRLHTPHADSSPYPAGEIAAAQEKLKAHLLKSSSGTLARRPGAPSGWTRASKNFDPRKEIRTFADVLKFPTSRTSICDLQPEVWVPAAFKGKPFNIFETGGTTGMPKQRIGWNDYKVDYSEFSDKIPTRISPRRRGG